jgi:hypothetical protein
VRQFLLALGAKLQELWAGFVHLVDRLLWDVKHEWGDSSFFVLIVVALGAALWSLRSRYLGRAGK